MSKKRSKWAEKLGSHCSIDPSVLDYILEELSESCYGDAATSKKVIEELTVKCDFSEEELRKFIRDVSENCPMDAKKLHIEITKAEGKKELAFNAINKVVGKAF